MWMASHRQLERDHLGATFPFLHVRYDPVSDEADLRYLSSRRGFGRFVVGYSSDFVIPSHSGFICIVVPSHLLLPSWKTSSLSERITVDHFSTSLTWKKMLKIETSIASDTKWCQLRRRGPKTTFSGCLRSCPSHRQLFVWSWCTLRGAANEST